MEVTEESKKFLTINTHKGLLKRLQDADVKANKKKCEFFRDRALFCRHEIDRGGLHKTLED